MTRTRRLSAQTTAVVLALAEQPASWRYGYQLCQQLDLKAGSVYPILMRLADRGLLETTWERDVPAGRHGWRAHGPHQAHGVGRGLVTAAVAAAVAAAPFALLWMLQVSNPPDPPTIRARLELASWMAVFATPAMAAAWLLWRAW